MNITAENDAKELYVVNGGQGNILIYGSDFFPHLVLGAGRGIESPQCVFFDLEHGRVYVGQNHTAQKPNRLTILNAAFLPENEVDLTAIPGAEKFSATNGMVGKNGKIYLVGNQSRGVLVLDAQGNFSHWLKPRDKIFLDLVKTTDSSEERMGHLIELQKEGIEPKKEEMPAAPLGLPAELLPKPSRAIPKDQNKDKDLQPVLLHDIAIDSDGRIFLLSEETSKVYVYGPGENFLFSFGQKGGSSGKMSRPRGLSLDEKKKCIYIVDYMRHTILVFDMAGRYIFEFGGRGAGPMWFNFPSAIDVDRQGRVIIADLFNNRIQILESDFTISYPVFGGTKGIPAKNKAKETNAPKQPEK
jgi:DNA-binding beta-propeller fold protein YncE